MNNSQNAEDKRKHIFSNCIFAVKTIYRQFSVISQDFVKYQLSLRENIGISMPNRIHDDERLMQSAKAANIENVENGSHSELLDMNGEYSRIWNEQAKWYV
ncbi:MAG: hypothetical protein FWD23_14265 [Oscillospiraceae bacterium]|nr:hypothetical protein [Oscillospiraceae bacterium]